VAKALRERVYDYHPVRRAMNTIATMVGTITHWRVTITSTTIAHRFQKEPTQLKATAKQNCNDSL
jgi:hypothetical protein